MSMGSGTTKHSSNSIPKVGGASKSRGNPSKGVGTRKHSANVTKGCRGQATAKAKGMWTREHNSNKVPSVMPKGSTAMSPMKGNAKLGRG